MASAPISTMAVVSLALGAAFAAPRAAWAAATRPAASREAVEQDWILQDYLRIEVPAALKREVQEWRQTYLRAPESRCDDPQGILRNPDISYDGRRVLFAWKKSNYGDDFHLYELEVDRGVIHQVTRGVGAADYEGVYLPDGNILFSSTRCCQTVDCNWVDVSNLYLTDSAGRSLRRLGFDQVHTLFPTVTDEGRRELLVEGRQSGDGIGCRQIIPLAPRPLPPIRPSEVDYRKDTGTLIIQDVYQGRGLRGIARGTVKHLRAVALEYRAAAIGNIPNQKGRGGSPDTPVPWQNVVAWRRLSSKQPDRSIRRLSALSAALHTAEPSLVPDTPSAAPEFFCTWCRVVE